MVGHQRVVVNTRSAGVKDGDPVAIVTGGVVSDNVVGEIDAAAPDHHAATVVICLVVQDVIAKYLSRGVAGEVDAAAVVGRCLIVTDDIALDQGGPVFYIDATPTAG